MASATEELNFIFNLKLNNLMRLGAITLDSADIVLDLLCFVLKIKEVNIKKEQFGAILFEVFHVTLKTE